MKDSGLIPCLVIIIVSGLLSRLSMHLLMSCSFKANMNSYSELVSYALGPKI